MPELPEVETIRAEIAPYILGRHIKNLEIYWPSVTRTQSSQDLILGTLGKQIIRVRRRGKYLILELNSQGIILLHLGMSGSLTLGAITGSAPKYARAAIILDDGTTILFCDPRKFGSMMFLDDTSALEAKLGPEPLESSFTPARLASILQRRRAPIKAVLVDQSLIAGIGNMYADEALFLARIHPLRRADSLTSSEISSLHQAIQRALRAGIDAKGATVSNYRRPDGSTGRAQEEFRVAHRKGKTCPRCGAIITRTMIRGRGSYFCPGCQPEHKSSIPSHIE